MTRKIRDAYNHRSDVTVAAMGRELVSHMAPIELCCRHFEISLLEDGAIQDGDPTGPEDYTKARAGPLHCYGRPLGEGTRSIGRGQSVVDRVWLSWAGEPAGESFLFLFFLCVYRRS